MKNYEGANIRNVALVGHSHSGKTSLASAMLFTAGATQRLGRVDEGNTITDYDEEEISRAMSISAATAFVEWGKTKINLIDTPGFNMFIHEAEMALPAVEAALVVVDAVSGVEVVTERIWHYCDKLASAARHRLHPHGPRARRLHARDGIAHLEPSDAPLFRCSCPSARKRASAASSTW